ncbi:MAG: hypothetical protein ABIZ04_17625 [Opitutus sp.]
MKMRRIDRASGGFALVITITLMALLILAVCALSALVGVNGQIATVTSAQTRAHQNALLGLAIGTSDLQRFAGPDNRVTGMAGITGIPANAASTTRNWCGVWSDDGSFLGWFTSGAESTGAAALKVGAVPIKLVGDGVNGGAGSVGASAAHSEHVIAGKVAIVATGAPGTPATATTIGSYAFLVTDEGVKVSAYARPSELAIPGVKPQLTSTNAASAQGKLRAALDSYAAKLPALLTYEQLSLLPTPFPALTQSVLQDNFHHVTLTAGSVEGSQVFSGMINLNTASPYVWRSVLETYNSVAGVTPISSADLSLLGANLAAQFAASASNKAAGGPFTSVAGFGASALLAGNLPATITPPEFMAAIGAMLGVRSDTFRVRAYGEATRAIDGSIEAVAYCEAVLQRISAAAPNALGRQFVMKQFRWLGPDDI